MYEPIRGSRTFASGDLPVNATCDRCGRRESVSPDRANRIPRVCVDCRGDKRYSQLRLEKG